jgi:hypothetical protein
LTGREQTIDSAMQHALSGQAKGRCLKAHDTPSTITIVRFPGVRIASVMRILTCCQTGGENIEAKTAMTLRNGIGSVSILYLFFVAEIG